MKVMMTKTTATTIEFSVGDAKLEDFLMLEVFLMLEQATLEAKDVDADTVITLTTLWRCSVIGDALRRPWAEAEVGEVMKMVVMSAAVVTDDAMDVMTNERLTMRKVRH